MVARTEPLAVPEVMLQVETPATRPPGELQRVPMDKARAVPLAEREEILQVQAQAIPLHRPLEPVQVLPLTAPTALARAQIQVPGKGSKVRARQRIPPTAPAAAYEVPKVG